LVIKNQEQGPGLIHCETVISGAAGYFEGQPHLGMKNRATLTRLHWSGMCSLTYQAMAGKIQLASNTGPSTQTRFMVVPAVV
jgi:hypothetical protein